MKILFRIIVFPFVAAIGLAFSLKLWIKFCLNFLANGGEIISFTKESRKTIAHILEIVEAKHEQDRITTEAWKKALREMKPTEAEEDQPIEITINYEKA
ncbi:MAG: hypothetical protein IPH04_14800 [Saprospirales bacterium]|nr:hypothetical protein [Saprospirales bacterium]